MSLVPALIMFTITAAVVMGFILPATFERKSPLLNFYWTGVWLFPALIAAVSGGEQVVMMLGLDASGFALRLQTALLVCFPLFVVAAWVRLSGAALMAGLRRIRA